MKRLLIANRGEIAVRVARAAREMSIAPLGIYSDADANAYHLRFMEDAIRVGPAPAAQSYLDIGAVVAAAITLHADAIHPGYGFLSERADFARAVRDAGMTFVGPSPEAMAAMGSKIEAKHRARAAEVPTVPGYDGPEQTPERLRTETQRIGFPILIKASAGGGGRGMRVVESLAGFDEALEAAKREALAAFGDDAILLERYLRDPRHIEFQILADAHGTTLHIGERECSIQRRHQKIIEEAPSVALSPELRATMGAAAVRVAASVGYANAGTVEFMLDTDGAFYFLEMNARLQVEHPVTELVYGMDIVQWQLRIARGEPLTLEQSDIVPRGWAIEARIYAEDPANDMLPSIGTIERFSPPQGPGIRVDAGIADGSEIGIYYDPMLAKLIVYGADRMQAIARLDAALCDLHVDGVRTNVPLLAWIARDEHFRSGETTTSFLAQRLDDRIFKDPALSADVKALGVATLLAGGRAPWRIAGIGIPLLLRCENARLQVVASRSGEEAYRLEGDLDGELHAALHGERIVASIGEQRLTAKVHLHADASFTLSYEGSTYRFCLADPPNTDSAAHLGAGTSGRILSPMPGKIANIAVRVGEKVADRALLLVLEAMKMEHRIEAPIAGTVFALHVREGEIVSGGVTLVEIE